MNAPGRTIDTASATPGQRLADAVLDEHGNVLVGAGCELTAGLIRSLSRRGVEHLCIAPDEIAAPDAPDAAALADHHQRATARVAHLFRHATRQGRLNPLMHSVLQHRLEGPA